MLHRSPRGLGRDSSFGTLEMAAQVSFEEGLTERQFSGETIRARGPRGCPPPPAVRAIPACSARWWPWHRRAEKVSLRRHRGAPGRSPGDHLRACLVKVRVNLFVGLGYAEDLIVMAFFGRNASKTEEATPKTAHIRLFPVAKKQI